MEEKTKVIRYDSHVPGDRLSVNIDGSLFQFNDVSRFQEFVSELRRQGNTIVLDEELKELGGFPSTTLEPTCPQTST